MTKLQILLENIEFSQEDKDDAILEYFNDQDADEYKVGEETYYILDYNGVKDILKEQYQDEIKEFLREIKRNHDFDFSHIIHKIDSDEILESLVDDFAYDNLYEYNLEVDILDEGLYIYTMK